MPAFTRLQMGVVDLRASQFERVEVRAVAGGIDRIQFTDSPGDDQLRARPATSHLAGDGFRNEANGFEFVTAVSAKGGVDTATFYDSAGDYCFVARDTVAFLTGDHRTAKAIGFGQVDAYATQGGGMWRNCTIRPGTPFVARPDVAVLTNDAWQHRAVGFEAGQRLFDPRWQRCGDSLRQQR